MTEPVDEAYVDESHLQRDDAELDESGDPVADPNHLDEEKDSISNTNNGASILDDASAEVVEHIPDQSVPATPSDQPEKQPLDETPLEESAIVFVNGSMRPVQLNVCHRVFF